MTRASRALGAVGIITVTAGLFFAVTATASATPAGPWWYLAQTSRPGYIHPGAGKNEVQEVTVQATAGDVLFRVAGHFGAFHFDATHEAVQQAIGEIVGAGNVSVTGGPGGAGGNPYVIEFQHALAGQALKAITSPAISRNACGFEEQVGHPVECLKDGEEEGFATVTELAQGAPDAVLVGTAVNVGVASTNGGQLEFVDRLPTGVRAVSAEDVTQVGNGQSVQGECELEPTPSAERPTPRCTFDGLELQPFQQIEFRVGVVVEATPPEHGVEEALSNEFDASGGGTPEAKSRRPLQLSAEPTPIGLQEYGVALEEEGGSSDRHAGSHPLQATFAFGLYQGPETLNLFGFDEASPTALPKDLSDSLPPGLIGNPQPFPRCQLSAFLARPVPTCRPESIVGVAVTTASEGGHIGLVTLAAPIYNLEPAYGEPARFGFLPIGAAVPIYIDTSIRSGSDYGIDAVVHNITQETGFLSSIVTFWGTPGAASHDAARGYSCLVAGRKVDPEHPCQPLNEVHPPPFFSLPTTCAAPLQSSATVDSWLLPGAFRALAIEPIAPLEGCNRVPFTPTIESEPTSDAATSPTGLSFGINVNDEGEENENGLVQSQIKKAVVTLPEGFTTNPSVAEGLHACSLAQYESENVNSDPGTGCPEDSKIGDVEIESPLVSQKVLGSLFVAKQGENPNPTSQDPNGNLLTIYLVAKNPELGVLIKQALRVTPDPVTGQLTTEVDNVPQLPFSHFHLAFRSGQRSPLITPPACGPYTVRALLYPYSEPNSPVEGESSFQIIQGPEGLGCPSGGVPPFHPALEAGTQNNSAGSYSPFYTRISRKDSEQEITHFSIKLPPGLSGKLAGVAKCSDAQIAAAKAREKELGGQEEIEHPSCPANSEVGHTLVGTGVGNVLAYAPGKLYLAGPYKGSQISIVSITAAKVGPFDLGTVVIREGLKVNPETAQVSVDAAGSDPIPHIVDGIPVHLRDIRIYVDRPNFVINPTSCAKTSTAANVLGSGQNFASEADDVPVTVTSPFQAADCASLGFKPNLALSLKGKTKRGGLPKLTAVVTYPKGGPYANIAKTVVTLPPSEFLEQGHIGSSCTRVQFNAGAGNGSECPAKSILGKAKAITPLLEEPVEGNVYLRSNGGERKLPDLVAALHSEDIDINLVGFISSLHKKGSEVSQIRNTFAAVPDAPVSKFTLELFGGKKGLLVNSTNICKGTHKAISEFTGQNGKLDDTEPAVKAQCGKKGKKSKKGGGKKSKSGKGR